MAAAIPGWKDPELQKLVDFNRVSLASIRTLGGLACLLVAGALSFVCVVTVVGAQRQCRAASEKYPDGKTYCDWQGTRETLQGDLSGDQKRAICDALKGQPSRSICMTSETHALSSLVPWALVFALVGCVLFWSWGQSRKYGPSFLTTLRENPRRICWVYLHSTQRPGGSELYSWVELKFVDGERDTISLPPQGLDRAVLMSALSTYLPWATFGFTSTREERFRRDPRSLLVAD